MANDAGVAVVKVVHEPAMAVRPPVVVPPKNVTTMAS